MSVKLHQKYSNIRFTDTLQDIMLKHFTRFDRFIKNITLSAKKKLHEDYSKNNIDKVSKLTADLNNRWPHGVSRNLQMIFRQREDCSVPNEF